VTSNPGTRKAAIALALGILLAAAALAGCGEAVPGNGGAKTVTTVAKAGGAGPYVAAVGGSAGAAGSRPAGSAGAHPAVREVADPEEGHSFPATGSISQPSAATPATAGQAIAAGAPSDAEVRQELHQMQAAEHDTQQGAPSTEQGGYKPTNPVPGGESIGGNGAIPIPTGVPEVVQKVVAGANAITDFPYVFGGGHASFVDNAYDCSGSVSYALAAGGLLSAPQTSGELENWGAPGPGRYITVYANAGHTYMYVDGILYDTAGRSGVYASRWQVGAVDNAGYVVRHWPGL
jgi:cell wall-associated NlpC family hydrolase